MSSLLFAYGVGLISWLMFEYTLSSHGKKILGGSSYRKVIRMRPVRVRVLHVLSSMIVAPIYVMFLAATLVFDISEEVTFRRLDTWLSRAKSDWGVPLRETTPILRQLQSYGDAMRQKHRH